MSYIDILYKILYNKNYMIKKRHLELVVSQSEPLEPSEPFAGPSLESVDADVSAEVVQLNERRVARLQSELASHSMPELQSLSEKFGHKEEREEFMPSLETELQEIERMINESLTPHSETLADLIGAQQGAIAYIRLRYNRESIQSKSQDEQFAFFSEYVDPLRKRVWQLGAMDIEALQHESDKVRDARAAMVDERVKVVDFRAPRDER